MSMEGLHRFRDADDLTAFREAYAARRRLLVIRGLLAFACGVGLVVAVLLLARGG